MRNDSTVKNNSTYLTYIAQALDRIFFYMPEDHETFFENLQAQDAIIRNLTIVGEAVKNLSLDFRRAHPEIPWKQIAGTRDRLVHQYFLVDLELVFEMVQVHLPVLRRRITEILEELGADDSPTPRP